MRAQGRERAKNPTGFLKMVSSIKREACQPFGPVSPHSWLLGVAGQPVRRLSVLGSARQPQLLNSGSVHQASESVWLSLSGPMCSQSASELGC